MEKIYEIKEYILRFYSKYSRYVDWGFRFLLALLTFAFINNQVGFFKTLSGPVATVGLALVCSFLPVVITVLSASVLVLVHFFTLTAGAAVVSGILMLFMFAMYFRFAPGKSVILLLTPIAFYMEIPLIVPIIFGLISGPICVIPIAFGTIVYFMISYVKSFATVIETTTETGVLLQIVNFAQQLFSNKEMWLSIVTFTICLFLVYGIRKLSVDRAWEIAVAAGVLVNILLLTFGHVMLDVEVSYVNVIIGSIATVLIALIVEVFVFSVDYSRTEYLQFEDDEYCYYVKAVPKISVAVSEKTIKKINVRQEKAGHAGVREDINPQKRDLKKDSAIIEAKKDSNKTKRDIKEEEVKSDSIQKRFDIEESEIQKIIEKELKN